MILPVYQKFNLTEKIRDFNFSRGVTYNTFHGPILNKVSYPPFRTKTFIKYSGGGGKHPLKAKHKHIFQNGI